MEDSDFELAKGIRNSAPIIDTEEDKTKAKTTTNTEPTHNTRPEDVNNIRCLDYKEEPKLTKNCEQCSSFEVNALQSGELTTLCISLA